MRTVIEKKESIALKHAIALVLIARLRLLCYRQLPTFWQIRGILLASKKSNIHITMRL